MSNYIRQTKPKWFLSIALFVISTYSFGQNYCTPKYNFVDCNTLLRRLSIYNVALNNRTFNTSCSEAGYAGVVNKLLNGTIDPIVLTSGSSYTMLVNTVDYDAKTWSSVSNQSNFAIWIDYDNNGTFDNTELVRTGTSSTFNLSINANAGGDYRMRIRARASSATNDPCAQQDYGETEDYLLRVLPPVPTVLTSQFLYPCANASFTLSASGCPGGIIQWRDQADLVVGNNPASVQTNQNKSYYATCVINGTPSSASTRVYAYPTVIPTPSISSNNYNLTVGQSAALTATGCTGTVTWSTGQTGSTLTITPAQSTTYSVTCTASYYPFCTSIKSNEITIGVNAPSAPALSANKNIVCTNETAMLSATGCAGTIKWSTGVTGVASITVSPVQSTTYSASCLINNVEGAKATTTISVNPVTAIATQPATLTICEAGQVALGVVATGSGNLAYIWSRNGQPLTDSSATTSQLVLRNVTTANNGTYQVKVTGTCGVVQSTTVTVQISPKMTASVSPVPVTCSGDANGTITVSVNGGLNGKQYRLVGQSDYQNLAAFTNLRAGTYTVQVRDVAGCMVEASAEVKQPDRISFTVKAPVNAKCAGSTDGAVDVLATGGNGGFTYFIIDGASQSTGQFQNLKANTTYIFKVTDGKGCSETTNAFVGAPNQIIVSLTPTPVDCAGGSTGQISAVASGGAGSDYKYLLDQGQSQSSNTFLGLKAALYTVTVKDANGCEGKADVTISQPPPVSLTATSSLVSCVNDSSASITVLASGGTGLFQYQVNTRPFQSTVTFSNIREGAYTITAKDAKGCTASTVIAVKKADPLVLQASTQAASCCTCPDGSISLNSSGGIGQKQYQFGQQALQSGNTFKGIAPGRYAVTVRDEAGCPTSQTVTIVNATAATVTLTNLKNVNCVGGHDGAATAQIAGGKKPFTYAWQSKIAADSLGTGATTTRLPEGEFTVTVTDSNRCSIPASGTLTALNPLPPKPTISASGGNLVSSAQSGVQWYKGPDLKTGKPVQSATLATFTPFESSPYFVVVTANSCASLPSDVFNFILTAVEPVLQIVVRVTPNPISGQLRIEVEQPERAELHIKLVDVTGRLVLDVATPAFSGKKQFSWPLPYASAGTYILQADSGLHKATQRVVVY